MPLLWSSDMQNMPSFLKRVTNYIHWSRVNKVKEGNVLLEITHFTHLFDICVCMKKPCCIQWVPRLGFEWTEWISQQSYKPPLQTLQTHKEPGPQAIPWLGRSRQIRPPPRSNISSSGKAGSVPALEGWTNPATGGMFTGVMLSRALL